MLPAVGANGDTASSRHRTATASRSSLKRCRSDRLHASLLSSPEPPYGHPDRLGVGLTCRLSDYSFVVQHYIDSSPDPQAHACAESKRVGGIALADAVD